MAVDTKLHITLEEGEKVFFTSDLHFGHRNVLNFCNRPFVDVKDMGLKLIDNWNSVVSDDDTVFILGDVFWFDDSRSVAKCFEKLNGKRIFIIPGNHDTEKEFSRIWDPRIVVMDSCVTVWIEGLVEGKPSKSVELFLSHYPLMTWPHRMYGVVQLFGHIHSGPHVEDGSVQEDQDLPFWPGQQYDVGVDNNEYYPIEIHDIYVKLGREKEL